MILLFVQTPDSALHPAASEGQQQAAEGPQQLLSRGCHGSQVSQYTADLSTYPTLLPTTINYPMPMQCMSNQFSILCRQWKLQRERLQEQFTKALDNFQRAQRSAAQKEKDAIKKYKNQGVSITDRERGIS